MQAKRTAGYVQGIARSFEDVGDDQEDERGQIVKC